MPGRSCSCSSDTNASNGHQNVISSMWQRSNRTGISSSDAHVSSRHKVQQATTMLSAACNSAAAEQAPAAKEI